MRNSLIIRFSDKQEERLRALFGDEQLAIIRNARKNKYTFLLLHCTIPGLTQPVEMIVHTDEPLPMYQVMHFHSPEEFEKFDRTVSSPYSMVQGHNMAICFVRCLHDVDRDLSKFPRYLDNILECSRQAAVWYRMSVLDPQAEKKADSPLQNDIKIVVDTEEANLRTRGE